MTKSPENAAVLFDLDGTLLDTAADFAHVVNGMRSDRQLEPLSYELIRGSVSDGARALIKLAFGLVEGDPGFAELLQELLDRYENNLAVHTTLFDDLDQTLDWLEQKRIPWGIVTNKPVLYAEKILQQLELDERCAVLICPDHVQERKPHPEGLHIALQKTGASAADSFYVGDHRRDIEAGINAAMATIACRWGYIHADDSCESWQPDHIVDSGGQLLALLQKSYS